MSTREVIAVAVIAVIAVLAISYVVDSHDQHEEPEITDSIGIIGATSEEVTLIKESMNIEYTKNYAGMKYFVGTIGDKNVVVVQCGMGKVNAGVCAEVLISHFQVSKIINTGVAGSLSKDLHVGDVVVSTDAVQHDYDLTPIGYPKGEIPDTGRYAFEADKELRESAMRIIKNIDPELNVMEGRICSGDQFISSVADRETITNNFGGLCCEMEGGAIAHVCYLNDTPFIIIRAISDNADGTGGDEYLKNKDVIAERSASIVWTFVEEL